MYRGFSYAPIPDAIFEIMKDKSFKTDCTIPREELSYLRIRHVDLQGKTQDGEMVVNRRIAKTVLSIFQELYAAKYPIEKIRLVDHYDADDERSMTDNNSSSFTSASSPIPRKSPNTAWALPSTSIRSITPT